MILREYDHRDSRRLYEISCSSLDQTYDEGMFAYFHMQWPRGQIVACDYSGKPMGFISTAKIDMSHARIMMFAVDREHRSSGIGSKLLGELKRVAMMNGINRISLEVRSTNTNAIEFYRKRGFVASEILENYYTDGGDAVKMDAIVQLNI